MNKVIKCAKRVVRVFVPFNLLTRQNKMLLHIRLKYCVKLGMKKVVSNGCEFENNAEKLSVIAKHQS